MPFKYYNGEQWENVSGIHLNLLWENADDTAGFAAQSVPIQGRNYSIFLVISKARIAHEKYHNDLVIKNQAAELICKDNQAQVFSRAVTITSVDATFETGYGGNTASPNYCVPKAIYGID